MLKTIDFIGFYHFCLWFYLHAPSHSVGKSQKGHIFEGFYEFSMGRV